MPNGVVLCRKCRKPLPVGSVFCMYCGTEVIAREQLKKRKNRPHNSGSIRKMKNRSKPYAAYLPSSLGGKYIGSYMTALEAAEAIAIRKAEIPPSERRDWTLEMFWDYYKESRHFKELKKGTSDTLKAAWKRTEGIRKMKMTSVKTAQWQAIIDDMVDEGMSYSSCSDVRYLASRLCEEAMKDDIIDKNYSKLLQLPKKQQTGRDVFTIEEVELLKKHDSDIEAQVILILIYTGMRINELLNLKNSDVHDGYLIGGSKTAAGKNRIMPILPEISPYIESMRRDEGNLIHRNGKPVSVKFYRNKWFYEYLAKIGILTEEEIKVGNTPRITPHYARHTFSSLAKQAGVDKDVIIRVMGHTDYETTDRYYVELEATYMRQEMGKISSYVERKREEKCNENVTKTQKINEISEEKSSNKIKRKKTVKPA